MSLRHNRISLAGALIVAKCILRIEDPLGETSVPTTKYDADKTWRIFRVDLIGNNQLGVEAAKVLGAAILLRQRPSRRTSGSTKHMHHCHVTQLYSEMGIATCAPIQILLGQTSVATPSAMVQHVWHKIIGALSLPTELKRRSGNNFETDAAVLEYLFKAGEAKRERLTQLNAEISALLEILRQPGTPFDHMHATSVRLSERVKEAKDLAEHLQVTETAIEKASVYGFTADTASKFGSGSTQSRALHDQPNEQSLVDSFTDNRDRQHEDDRRRTQALLHNDVRESDGRLERVLGSLDLAQGRQKFGAAEQEQFVANRNLVRKLEMQAKHDRYADSAAHFAAQELYDQNFQPDGGHDLASELDRLAERRLKAGSYSDAISVFRRAAQIAKDEWRNGGANVVDKYTRWKLERFAQSLTRLADLLLSRNHLASEAATLYNEVLPYMYKLRGFEHTDVARIFDRIAAALSLQVEQLSPGQPGYTTPGYNDPGLMFSPVDCLPPTVQKLLRKIEYACLKSLRIRENHHRHFEAQRAIRSGFSHSGSAIHGPEMLLAMQMLVPLQQLGLCYLRLGDPERAEKFLQRALRRSHRHHSGSHVNLERGRGHSSKGGTPRESFQSSAIMQSVALVRIQQGRSPEAVSVLRRALDIRLATCGESHVATAQVEWLTSATGLFVSSMCVSLYFFCVAGHGISGSSAALASGTQW